MSDQEALGGEARWSRTGYGSKALQSAAECARGLRFGRREAGALQGALLFLWQLVRLPFLVFYVLRLPRLRVRLSEEPTGRMLDEHLSLRRWGLPRFRLAQGVMLLPADFATYMRGRRRQAVRTNVHRAHERGIRCHHETLQDWLPTEPAGHPGNRGLKCAAPTERWWATCSGGEVVGEAWLTIDRESALLHALVCDESNVRWLLHSAIVERLCSSGCRLLMTNSYDAPLMTPGLQYFQRLLGYTVAHLRPPERPATTEPRTASKPLRWAWPEWASVWRVSLTTLAVACIVVQATLPDSMHLAGIHALIWLTALVVVRLAVNRPGWTTLVGGLAGAIILALHIAEPVSVALAYLLCGLAIDVWLVAFPSFARRASAMASFGPFVMLLTIIAPRFPSVGRHRTPGPWAIPPVPGAILFGACAAVLGLLIARMIARHTGTPGRLGLGKRLSPKG
jgi:hypothetical protein